MKLPTTDYLHSRGWDVVREDVVPGGIRRIWKSRRTGEELSTDKAKRVQRASDMADLRARFGPKQ
jgi:hypothetical protein